MEAETYIAGGTWQPQYLLYALPSSLHMVTILVENDLMSDSSKIVTEDTLFCGAIVSRERESALFPS